jgi:hypothetical protein
MRLQNHPVPVLFAYFEDLNFSGAIGKMRLRMRIGALCVLRACESVDEINCRFMFGPG